MIDFREQTVGRAVILQGATPQEPDLTFIAGSKDFVEQETSSQGLVFFNGEVELADSSRYFAVIGISPQDGGEHWFTGIFVEDGFVTQDDPDFLTRLGKTKEQVFGYRYTYWPMGLVRDHHIDENTGWSR
jgi:hypothetical protein